jgi:hypothetical protein
VRDVSHTLQTELSKRAKRDAALIKPRTGTAEYFKRGSKGAKAGEDDVTIESTKRRTLQAYDKSLRKFR